ncbi:response regulator [Methylorubrum sp. SL192]|uniref:response regulator n=1 Tax=Methylorubrum sp. SL192 TaxID=2995167 RepID=UPI000A4AC2D6|nr:hypothetical protein [Methylorubrum sp. SL192]
MTDPADPSIPYALVVDDEGLIRMDAMDILQKVGFRTFEAGDGDKAIALLAREHALIVLVFTDVQMPPPAMASPWLARLLNDGHTSPSS